MKTAIEREQAFRRDLKVLLDNHGAELEAILIDGPHLYSAITEVSMGGQWDSGNKWNSGGQTHEFCEFDL